MQSTEQAYFQGEGLMTVRHLKVHGTNFEIGRRVGEIAIQRHGKTSADYLASPLYARARRIYFQRNYPIHWERTRGVAAAFGFDTNDDRYDFTGIRYNLDLPRPPGCSVVYYPPSTTASGGGYLSRNYDFSTGTLADLLGMSLPPELNSKLPRVMSEPYIMEWHPDDGGYASLAIQAFDALSGTLDGINSAGLVVSIMADEEALATLGPHLEPHSGPVQATGIHELQVMRFVLDTCATAAEAKEALLTAKQYYFLVPCHYIVADRNGNSFIYENSTGRNVQHVIEGGGRPQVVTNFQIYRHAESEAKPEKLTVENNAFWRYGTLAKQIAQNRGLFTTEDLKANNACVNVQRMLAEIGRAQPSGGVAATVHSRTLWHSLYDQNAVTAEFSFYLGETVQADGSRTEHRSDYLRFELRV